MNKKYITGKTEYNFNYAILPMDLFSNSKYAKLSANAKLLYSLLLNRTRLSLKNHFIDKKGRVYIFFTREEAGKVLNCSKTKCIEIFKELVSVDLIEEKTQKGKKANIIYVKMPSTVKKDQNKINRNKKAKKTLIEKQKEFLKKINTNIKVKQQKLDNIKNTIKVIEKQSYIKDVLTVKKTDIQEIHQQIEYTYFKDNCNCFKINKGFIDTIVRCVAEMKFSKQTKINGCYYSNIELVQHLENLSSCDIIELIENIKKVGFEYIKNVSLYIKTALFNIVNFNISIG